jgi:hypothetical protein
LEDYQQALGGIKHATKRALVPPSYWHVHPFFLFFELWTDQNTLDHTSKKIKTKKPKIPLYLRQKVDPNGYVVITLYKKYKNPKTPLRLNNRFTMDCIVHNLQ